MKKERNKIEINQAAEALFYPPCIVKRCNSPKNKKEFQLKFYE